MGQDSLISVATNARSRSDLVERGFSRQPLRVDVDIARTLETLSHAAWSIPRDKYYDGGDRYRSLNRLRAEIVEGGVKVSLSEESTPYVQLKKYNTTIGWPAARVRSAAPGDRRFHRRSQDDCSPPSLPAALGAQYLSEVYCCRRFRLDNTGIRYMVLNRANYVFSSFRSPELRQPI
jgi:hypothetical protein